MRPGVLPPMRQNVRTILNNKITLQPAAAACSDERDVIVYGSSSRCKHTNQITLVSSPVDHRLTWLSMPPLSLPLRLALTYLARTLTYGVASSYHCSGSLAISMSTFKQLTKHVRRRFPLLRASDVWTATASMEKVSVTISTEL